MEEKVAYQSYERARDIQVRPETDPGGEGRRGGPWTCRESWQQPEEEGCTSWGMMGTG